MGTTRARQAGGALLAVLWLSAALAAIAFSVAGTVRGEAERASTAVDGTRAYYLAQGGILRTTLHMLWSAQNPNLPPMYRISNRVMDLLQFPAGEVRVEIIPETSKFNINGARPEQLFRLLVNLGVEPGRAQEITAGILDWRSPVPGGGLSPFDQYYLTRAPSFRARHTSMEEIEELLLVRGMTPDIYYGTWQRGGDEEAPALARVGGLADCVSVFGAADRFDANTAHPAVLAAAGLPPDVVAAIVARRRAAPFGSDAELAQFLQGAPAALARLRVGGNSIYTLRATARLRLANGQFSDLRRTVAALVKFMPAGYDYPYHILRWYDMAWEGRVKPEYRHWLAFGTGVGIEIRGGDLEIAAARVRPSGAQLLGRLSIRNFRSRPAAEWGADYAAFLRKLGEARLSATVLLPRSEVIVRQLAMPGVPAKELEAAIAWQLDSLHPYGEDEAVWGWSPLGGGAVLIGILRRTVMDRYVELFAEAGIAVASFTFSAAAIHAAARVFGDPPAQGFVAVSRAAAAGGGAVEVYGESPARPVFSAEFEAGEARALALGAAELRLPPDAAPLGLADVLPRPRTAEAREEAVRDPLPYAAAVAGACPRLSPAANLLPVALRHSNARAMFVPTAVLAGLLVATAAAALAYNRIADRSYLRKLQNEIAQLEPQARQAAALESRIAEARQRARLLDEFRARTRADLDALDELTGLLPPPIWTSSIDLTRDGANINGEAEEAAGLIKVIDASPLFRESEFSVITRTGSNELFRIHTRREGRR